MSDADLEGVIVQPSNRGNSTTMILLLEDLKQGVTICQTIIWPVHHAIRITDCVVQMLDLEAASVADLELGKCEGADTAIAVEAESNFKMRASGVRGIAFIVRDCDFFPRIDIMDCVNSFTLGIAIPTMVSIWKTAMIN